MLNQTIPHRIALHAMLIAIGLPIVLFMFLAVRTRQLQSTSNPRWAQFAKVTGPSAGALPEIVEPINSPAVEVDPVPVQTEPEAFADDVRVETSQELQQPERPDVLTKTELEGIRQQLDQLTQLQTQHQADENRLGLQLLGLLNVIRDLVTDLSSTKTAPGNQETAVETVSGRQKTDIVAEDWSTSTQETARARGVGETALGKAQPDAKSQTLREQASPAPITLRRVPLDKSLTESKYYLCREGNCSFICTADEANRFMPEQMDRIPRSKWPNDARGFDMNQLTSLIMTGLANGTSNQFSEELSKGLATSQSFSISRRALARVFYECAANSWQTGNDHQARQQIEASLRQNKDDIDAIRLRNEINLVSAHAAAR